jgi:aldose 1-epimerase
MTSRRAHVLFGCFLSTVLVFACSGSQPAPVATATAATSVSQTASEAVDAATPATPELDTRVKTRAIGEASYGTVGGVDVKIYTLQNKHGLVAKITNYGGILTEFHAPDRTGKLADVVLGYDRLDDYVRGSPYFGAVIGRVANRIKNAQFTLDGKSYKLTPNNGKHILHGGKSGWDKAVWVAEMLETAAGPSLKLSYVSDDGDEGFPGRVVAHNVYTLTNDDQLKIEMDATTDKPTIVSMAHHTYWNLGGHDSGPITDEELTLFAEEYTPGDPVPDGKIKRVKGTPFDFNAPKLIGKDLQETGGSPLGFDANWIVKGDVTALRPVARLKDPKSGRVLELSADQPGVQFYSGNFLDGSNKGKGGVAYPRYAGLCLESQKFPNAINVPAWKEQVILRPGADYRHTMVLEFSVE